MPQGNTVVTPRIVFNNSTLPSPEVPTPFRPHFETILFFASHRLAAGVVDSVFLLSDLVQTISSDLILREMLSPHFERETTKNLRLAKRR